MWVFTQWLSHLVSQSVSQWFIDVCRYFTPIRLELLSRSRTNQIVTSQVVSFVCQVWDSAIFVFCILSVFKVGWVECLALQCDSKARNRRSTWLVHSANSQTSETINLPANCSDRLISLDPSGWGIWLFTVWKRQRIYVFRVTGELRTLKAFNRCVKRGREREDKKRR